MRSCTGNTLIAQDPAYDYLVSAQPGKSEAVKFLAEKCLRDGIVDRVLKPMRTFRLQSQVIPVINERIQQAEDALGSDEWIEYPSILTGTQLASAIVTMNRQGE